jgi:Flp pilus assembly pilin Flp
MIRQLRSLWEDEAGVTTVEYALILALVSIVAISAWQSLGERIEGTVQAANDSMPSG